MVFKMCSYSKFEESTLKLTLTAREGKTYN